MRSVFTLDEPQLTHIEAKLAELGALSAAEQMRKQYLVDALLREKTDLLRCRPRQRRHSMVAA